MISSLGFDTIVIHIDRYNLELERTFDFLYGLGVKNFIFVFDFDPLSDSVSIFNARFNRFKNISVKASSHRVKIKCAFNLHISQGAAFNDYIERLYVDKKSKAVFVSLPLFTETNYEPIALDINHLLYKRSAFPIFTSFEKTLETSSKSFCSKFVNNLKMGLEIDINYLFNPQKQELLFELIKNNSLVLPGISRDISNYAGIVDATEHIIELCGKKNYYKLCSQINKCSLKISF